MYKMKIMGRDKRVQTLSFEDYESYLEELEAHFEAKDFLFISVEPYE